MKCTAKYFLCFPDEWSIIQVKMLVCIHCHFENTPWAKTCSSCEQSFGVPPSAGLSSRPKAATNTILQPILQPIWQPPWEQSSQALDQLAPESRWLDIDKVDTSELLLDSAVPEQAHETANVSAASLSSASTMPIFAATTRGVYLADDESHPAFMSNGPSERRRRWSQRVATLVVSLLLITSAIWAIRHAHETTLVPARPVKTQAEQPRSAASMSNSRTTVVEIGRAHV